MRCLIVAAFFIVLSLASYFLCTAITDYFVFLGAYDILPQLFYIIYTLAALSISIYGCDTLVVRGKERTLYLALPVNTFSVVVAKTIPIYCICFVTAVFAVFVPTAFLVKGIGFVFMFPITFLLPLFPMFLSTLWVYLTTLFKNTDTKNFKLIKAILFFAFLALLAVFGAYVYNLLKSNAYQTTALISKYYFPAAFFSSAVTLPSFLSFAAFTVTNAAAFYIYLYVLKIINKL